MIYKTTNCYSLNTKDKSIRPRLIEELSKELKIQQKKDGHPARIFSEFGLAHGQVRADIVTVNGIIHGYEIKSDLDDLTRLPAQTREYAKVFDKATLVVGEKHVIGAIDLLPEWWGIVLTKKTIDGEIVFSRIRNDKKNPNQDSLAIAELLWRDEALDILKTLEADCGLRSSRRAEIYSKLACAVSRKKLLDLVKEVLISGRQGWRADQLQLLYDD